MTVAPDPSEIYYRAVEEGARRLDQSLLELASTSFIAGFTIVFGIIALGIVHALIVPVSAGIATIGGAFAFGFGLVLLVIGRVELFNENFFDPTAKAVDQSDSWLLWPLLRLWAVTFAFNLVGGGLFALVFAVEGVLPSGTPAVLTAIAEEIVHRRAAAGFAKAIVGGALVSLLSFLLEAVDSAGSRITITYIVGVMLALGPFDHVIVTALHVFFGILFGANIGLGTLAVTTAIVTAGNFVGGLGLVTLSHVTQVVGAEESNE